MTCGTAISNSLPHRPQRVGLAATILSALSLAGCERNAPPLAHAPGKVEAIPQRTFRIMPYFDLPVFELSNQITPGKRLSWSWDKDGKLQPSESNPLLITVAETPHEVTRQEIAIETAQLQKEVTATESAIALTQARDAEDASTIRLKNSLQESSRITGLQKSGSTTQEAVERARNTEALARVQHERAQQQRELQEELAAKRSRMAEKNEENVRNDADEVLTKRGRYGWLSIPFKMFSGPNKHFEVVVTKITVAYGDQPPRQGGNPPVWIELVDDSEVYVVASIPPSDEEFVRNRLGSSVTVEQQGRSYPATVTHILPVVDQRGDNDPNTYDVRVLLTVTNDTARRLHIDSGVSVNFLAVPR